MTPSEPRENGVDPLFLEFLRLGSGADLASFCANHPRHAARLRELHAAHELVLAHLAAADVPVTRFAADPTSLLAQTGSGRSAELLRRILAQGPKGARYELRGEVARGGMGVILRVWDEDLGRELAMKVVVGSASDALGATTLVDARLIARFLEEAQITGQLDHPCVVPVHELGLDQQGQLYFTMRLVKGRDFDDVLALVAAGRDGWSRTRALGVLLRVCEAMAYAHSKGVVHRDLKPSNVMVGSFGEVYVMDWGLARALGRDDVHDVAPRDADAEGAVRTTGKADRGTAVESPFVTMDGEVIGTPAYMPPEQAQGRIDQITARSDVYAIGAILYHLLAGHPPYFRAGEKRPHHQVLRDVMREPPAPIAGECRDLPVELEAICEKAMARDPAARYADPLALGEDLRAYLEGRVVRAHQTGALVELRKWMARNRALTAAAAAALLFLVAGLAASLWQRSLAVENAQLAAVKAQEATEKGELAQRNAALADERAREADASAKRAVAVRDFLLHMLANASPAQSQRKDVRVAELLTDTAARLAAGEFASDPETERALLTTLGTSFVAVDQLEDGERQLRRALELSREDPGSDVFGRCNILLELVVAVTRRGDHAEGERLVREVLTELDVHGVGDHLLRARAQNMLADARYNLGALDEALTLARSAVEMRERIEGADTQETAKLRASLVFYLVQKGAYDEASTEAERVIAVQRVGPPSARMIAAEALRQRARGFAMRQRWEDAARDLRDALRIREELYAEDTSVTASLLSDLANVESNLNQLEDAEIHARRALEVHRRLVGDHRDTATAMTIVAQVARRRGDPAQAIALNEEALEMRRRVLPPESSAIGDSLYRLGMLRRDTGDLPGAERDLRLAIANWRESIGDDRVEVARARLALGVLLRDQRQWGEAKELLERALQVRIALEGALSGGANEARDELIALLLASEDWAAAEAFARETLALLESGSPKLDPLRAYLRAQLGAALLGQGHDAEAEELLLSAWKTIEPNPQLWAVNKLFVLDHLVLVYERRGDEANAAQYRTQAEQLRRR